MSDLLRAGYDAVRNEERLEAWRQKQRRGGLGGSDAPAACGLSPFKTQYELWLEKTGQLEPRPPSVAMRVGTELEPLVLAMAEEALGAPVRERQALLQDRDHSFLLATLDGVVELDGVPAVVEAKTTGHTGDWGVAGTGEVPEHVLIQVQHQLRVSGYALAIVPVLFQTRELVIYRVPADAELQRLIVERELAFWRRVLEKSPPDVTTAEDALRRWPRDSGDTATASPAGMEAHARLLDVKARLRELESEKDALEVALKSELQDAATLLSPGGQTLATWKTQERQILDAKRMKAEAPDLYKTWTTTQAIRVLRLKGEAA
jgi:putative phage-type endonuclease